MENDTALPYSKARRGRFSFTITALEQEPWLIRCILSHTIVYKSEVLLAEGVIEYHAISPYFRPVSSLEQTPFYIVSLSDSTGISFQERK